MTSKARRTMAAINAMADESQRAVDEAASRARIAAYNEFWRKAEKRFNLILNEPWSQYHAEGVSKR